MSIRQKTASNRASVIHCGELFRPGSTQPVKSVFKAADRRLIIHCNPGASQTGKKRKTSRKSKTPGALIYNVPGSRSGGIPLRAAISILALFPWSGRICLFRLIRSPLFAFSDAPPGRRSARSPTTFGSRSKDIVSFSGYYHLFPGISAYFQTVLNWTFGVFLQFYRFNHPLQPTGLQHDRTALFYIPSATRFASSTFRSSLAFNSSST